MKILAFGQKHFLVFVLSKYIETGFEELDEAKLSGLVTQKYHVNADAIERLGKVKRIWDVFVDFQKNH